MEDYPLSEKMAIAKKEARFYAMAISCGGLIFILLASYGFSAHYQAFTESLFLDPTTDVTGLYQLLLAEILPGGLMILGLVSIAAGIVQCCAGVALFNQIGDINSRNRRIYH